MSEAGDPLETEFQFGSTRVKILLGDILEPPECAETVEAIVSTDDNYLTMASGVAQLLRVAAKDEAYVAQAQAWCRGEAGSEDCIRPASPKCHVEAGMVVVTEPFHIQDHLPAVKFVLHGTVIDYDTEETPLDELVAQTTTNCLEAAEDLRLKSVLFPAFATGSGGLDMGTCSQQMCGAIKKFVARERWLDEIFVILRPPAVPESRSATEIPVSSEDGVTGYLRAANLSLGLPYDPRLRIRQSRDFFGREQELRQLEDLITGADETDNRHAVLLGGKAAGKWALLDQLYCRAQQPDSPLSEGRRLVRVTFGRVHRNTPISFVYRKFLCALAEEERDGFAEDESLKAAFEAVYSDLDLNCAKFIAFVNHQRDRYGEIVFLIDKLPRLLQMEARDQTSVWDFWKDLDDLEQCVRFVFTARNDEYLELRRRRLEPLTSSFRNRIAEVSLTCVSEQERRAWVDSLLTRYLGGSSYDSEAVQQYFNDEAGYHPYLISLVGYALIEAIRRDATQTGGRSPTGYTKRELGPYFRQSRQTIGGHRQTFFDSLLGSLTREQSVDIKTLARAVAVERELEQLLPDIVRGDLNAIRRSLELKDELGHRDYLHQETMEGLEAAGYLVATDIPGKRWNFMSDPLATYVSEYYRVGRRRRSEEEAKDLVITLLKRHRKIDGAEDEHDGATGAPPRAAIREEPLIWTMFRSRGARVVTAEKPLLPAMKREFMESFGRFLSHRLHPVRNPSASVFRDLEEVGSYILTQFATVTIKRELQRLPQGSTVLFLVDDALKDIPWELMLETAYAGEIPFSVGRSVVSPRLPAYVRPRERSTSRVKALLIGDPTDDLVFAQREVKWLRHILDRDERFAQPDVLIGSEQCQRIPLLNRMGSGEYDLIHYSGHTVFDGERSAWHLKDGRITTGMLTNALQMEPPALVFSSSCESARATRDGLIEYENQTFDLPGAFLEAGVPAYIGTLWEVLQKPTRQFVEEFYSVFLTDEYSLGDCLRRAKWASKQHGRWQDRINWLAFVLYGDPHLMPGDLLPTMRV